MLNPLSLSNNKNYRLKKVEFFLCNRRKIAAKLTIHQDSAVSKAFLDLKILKPKIWVLNPENYLTPRRHRLLGQTTKQL